MLSKAERGLSVPENERKAKNVQQDVEDTLARAADLIDQSKREVERSRQIVDAGDTLARAADLIDQSKQEAERSRQFVKNSEAAEDEIEERPNGPKPED